MKTIFVRLIAVVLLFIGLVWLIGFLLPRDYSIRSTIDIAAPPERVFPMINELAQWENWSPWSEQAGLDVQYSGESSGVGSMQTWSDPRGDGKLWISDSQLNQRVIYKMRSGGFPEMENTIQLKPTDDGTNVTWTSEGKLPSGAFYGYFARLFAPGMQAEYDRGLAKLKSVAEKDVDDTN